MTACCGQGNSLGKLLKKLINTDPEKKCFGMKSLKQEREIWGVFRTVSFVKIFNTSVFTFGYQIG